jgi:putative component of membrane protein insertase Oxa1/YidC/SpoIIIJ protein YidD
VEFEWNAGTGATLYQFCLSTIAIGGCDLFSYKGTALSATAASLPADGVIVYATLYSDVNGAWQQKNYLYTEGGTPVPAVLQSPTPGLSTGLGISGVGFTWNAGTGVTLYQLCLSAIEAGACDLFSYKGTALSATVPGLPANGTTVYATLNSEINGAWQENNYLYSEHGPAALQSPTPGVGTVLGTTNVNFKWSYGGGITVYQFCLSTVTPGACDLFSYKGSAVSATVASLPANGVTVYATLYSSIGGAWQQKNYLYTESGTAAPAVLQSPTPGSGTVLGTNNVGFQWTTGTGVAVYQLCLSAVASGECELFSYKGSAQSATVPSLPENCAVVYATLSSEINGVWRQDNYLYTESGIPAPAVLQSPTPGLSTVLGTSKVSFQWNAGTGVTLYQLCLSAIAPGECDLFSYKGSALSATVPSLPAGDEKVYATLWSKIQGTWQQNNYLYTESGSLAPGVLQSPTPGLSTVLGTSTVSFVWSAGSGVSLYQFCLSAIAAGECDVFLYKGTALSAIVASPPANGATVYATLWSEINGTWQQNNYLYTEQ